MNMSPDNFYGLPDLPFHLHLGMEFERPAPGDDATLRLPLAEHKLDADVTVHRAAMYTLGEVAAAVCALDALVDVLPLLMLTRAGEFRPVAPAHGTVWTSAEFVGEPEGLLESLQAKRKRSVTSKVSIFDEDDRLVAEMSATFLMRKFSSTMASKFQTNEA